MSKYTHDQWVQVQSPTVALGYEHTELMASAGEATDMFRKA